MIGYVALAITVIIIVSVCAGIDNWQRDWTTNFAETDSDASDPELRPLMLNQSSGDVAAKIRQWAEAHRDWQVTEVQNDSESTKMHLTRTTLIMRFVDDVRVTINDEGQGVIVQASSQSRVGKGDLGQNPRNLKALLKGIQE